VKRLTELKCIYQRWVSLEMLVVRSCERFLKIEAYHMKKAVYLSLKEN